MKTLFLGFFALLLAGCGSSSESSSNACATSSVLGTYTGTVAGQADTMVIASSCTITSSYCQSTSTIPNVTANSGLVTVTVTATSGRTGCLPMGATNCAYELSGNSLAFTCGGSILTYTKQ